MFSLTENRHTSRGLYCGSDGLYLGRSPLIECCDGCYKARALDEVAALLAAAYDEPPDAERVSNRLPVIAADLQRGYLAQAMISALLLRFGEMSDEGIERLARAELLLKYNFNRFEPRDRRGKWTRDGVFNPIVPVRADGSPMLDSSHAARAWENQPNAEFRNRLAIAEGNSDKKDFGYGAANERTGALGRYQLRSDGLRAAGMIDADGNWTGKYGIHSRARFLADPVAQERALTDYLQDVERQLKANGSLNFIGVRVNGVRDNFTITRSGLIAAAHRGGPDATYHYLLKIANNGYRSRGLDLDNRELAIETRLRVFAKVPYE